MIPCTIRDVTFRLLQVKLLKAKNILRSLEPESIGYIAKATRPVDKSWQNAPQGIKQLGVPSSKRGDLPVSKPFARNWPKRASGSLVELADCTP